jgi:predicted acetyltransferase
VTHAPAAPPRPAAGPVTLVEVDRSSRAVLSNLGQLYRYDLADAYGHLPNDDGTFNNRRLDVFLAGTDPTLRTWLVHADGRLAGFAVLLVAEGEPTRVADFFVVRTLRRSGVGRTAAGMLLRMFPGPWRIAFQRYNPGAERFWTQVATDLVGAAWTLADDEPVEGRPPDTWLSFRTGADLS